VKEVVTFGEVMMRLTPVGDDLLAQAGAFNVHIGGSEYNVAAGLVALGIPAMCVTRLPDNPLGRNALRAMRSNGVETPDDTLSPQGRLGIYFLEQGSSPRPNRVVYDRGESSLVKAAASGAFDWDRYLGDARWFHVSGITPALSPGLLQATQNAVRACRAENIPVSFDINYRAKLWAPDKARTGLEPLLRDASVIVSTEEDLERVFGIKGSTHRELVEKAKEKFGVETVAITLREMISVRRNRWSGCAVGPDGYFESRWYDVEIVDRVGAGDSFTAGLVAGLMERDLGYAVNMAAAFSALKHTMPGDVCLATRAQVEELMERGSAGRIQR